MFNSKRISTGIRLDPQNTNAPTLAGDLRYNSSTDQLESYDTALRNIVTDTGTQTLSNKIVISASVSPSLTGIIRLGNTENISWRNAAGSADLPLTVNASNNLAFNGNALLTATGALSASRVVVTDAGSALTTSSITATSLSYLDATSSIQTQLNTKITASSSDTLTNKDIRYLIGAVKTSNYTLITTTDEMVLGDSSGGTFTFTLPSAVGIAGKRFGLKKTDSSFTAISIATTSSQTIDGSTTNSLNTAGEVLWVQSEGTNWQIIERRIPCAWTSYSLTITGSISNPTLGTVTVNNALWRRIGDSIQISYQLVQTVAGTAGSGDYNFSIPSGLTMDTAKFLNTPAGGQTLGPGHASSDTSTDRNPSTTDGHASIYDSTHIGLKIISTLTQQFFVGSGAYALSGPMNYQFMATVPIVGWNG